MNPSTIRNKQTLAASLTKKLAQSLAIQAHDPSSFNEGAIKVCAVGKWVSHDLPHLPYKAVLRRRVDNAFIRALEFEEYVNIYSRKEFTIRQLQFMRNHWER